MGHERVGILPRRNPWLLIVDLITGYSKSKDIAELANQTIRNVRSRFKHIENDEGVHSTFKFLVLIAFASRYDSPEVVLSNYGIDIPKNFAPLHIAKALNNYLDKNIESNEYAAIAKESSINAISEWYYKNETNQVNIFSNKVDNYEVWKEVSNGAGFCELSRLFFAKFTENYLKYFLEREASASLQSIDERDRFELQLDNYVNDISNHAFETAKITQSFAAGWYNKHVKEEIPSDNKIQGFLSFSFKKMRDELLREEVR